MHNPMLAVKLQKSLAGRARSWLRLGILPTNSPSTMGVGSEQEKLHLQLALCKTPLQGGPVQPLPFPTLSCHHTSSVSVTFQ